MGRHDGKQPGGGMLGMLFWACLLLGVLALAFYVTVIK